MKFKKSWNWPRQISALDAAPATLHQQLLATSGVIKTLAEQNTRFIARIEAIIRAFRKSAAIPCDNRACPPKLLR
jgi:hypothetical protein